MAYKYFDGFATLSHNHDGLIKRIFTQKIKWKIWLNRGTLPNQYIRFNLMSGMIKNIPFTNFYDYAFLQPINNFYTEYFCAKVLVSSIR